MNGLLKHGVRLCGRCVMMDFRRYDNALHPHLFQTLRDKNAGPTISKVEIDQSGVWMQGLGRFECRQRSAVSAERDMTELLNLQLQIHGDEGIILDDEDAEAALSAGGNHSGFHTGRSACHLLLELVCEVPA